MYILKNKLYTFIVFLLDCFGYILFYPFRMVKKDISAVTIKNILIIRLDNIGDVVFSTSILKDLKNYYKNAKVTFLVSGAAKDLVINNPFIDEIICFDVPWFNKKKVGWGSIFALIRKLRSYRFDLGIDLRGDFRHILIMLFAGMKYKVGYGITGGGFILDRNVKYQQGIHAIEHNLDILRELGVKISHDKPEIYTKELDKNNATDILKQNGIYNTDSFAVVHPYANYPSKNWQDEYWKKLIDSLSKIYNIKIAIVGSSKDYNLIARLKNNSTVQCVDLSGKTSLTVLFEICKKAKLFIGIDSGPAHIAAASGLLTIVLFSGTNKASEWLPIGNKVRILEKDTPCKNCGKLNCIHNTCMDLISVEDVLGVIKGVI